IGLIDRVPRLAVTNAVPIAARLANLTSISLHLLGGQVRGLTRAVVGDQAVRALESLRVDIAFIVANGISVRHGLSTPDPGEAAVKRAMVACANFVVVVADSSKIGREEFVSFASIDRVDVLVTDSEIDAADRTTLSEHGVDVVVAQGDS
ncbi:MAG: D-beta-D-heptose 1-phosphate adenosyltransferase, partial [Mycobacteriaceae bacterium]